MPVLQEVDQNPFLAAQCSDPWDTTLTLIQADWLEEQGDAAGATVLRGLTEGGIPSLHALALFASLHSVSNNPDFIQAGIGLGAGDGHGMNDGFGEGLRDGGNPLQVFHSGDGDGAGHGFGYGDQHGWGFWSFSESGSGIGEGRADGFEQEKAYQNG